MPHRITNTENIIGENSIFKGSIKLSGALRVDGTFYGDELSMAHIVVGKTGKVKSFINTESIVVEGTIAGDIKASLRAMLLPTAKILGDISTPELIIQNGVMWDGHCSIRSNAEENVIEIINDIFK